MEQSVIQELDVVKGWMVGDEAFIFISVKKNKYKLMQNILH